MLESSQKKMSEKDVGRVGSIGITDMDAETATRMQSGEDTSFKSRLRQYFIEDKTTSLQIRLFNVFIKLLSCVLYCARVVQDSKTLPPFVKPIHHEEGEIRYEYLFWVERNEYLWLAQTIVAIISLCETVVVFYISYQGNTMRLLVNVHFLLELLTSFPFVITLFRSELRYLYVPVFLNCWLAKGSLQAMMNDLNRGSFMNQSALFRQLMLLFSVLICLIFTGMCSIEHLQRAGDRQFDLFTSLYFVMVTFSTVGYGDWYPDTWMSRLCVIILICVALVLLPSQLEALGQTWLERRKCGSDYRGGHTKNDSHVVVTITHLEVEFVRDFLDEFYAHPENKRVHVVLLSPAELDNQTRLLLKIPIYSERVFYVKGSALRDEDLERARVSAAKACFILSARHQNKKIITDEHTVLRSWAVKDFAPHVKQYVQIFRPETKMHIEHAEVLICEDEFKYSLLANNCICPGISTFITLLMHTSKGEEGKKSTEPWHKVYGFYSGNEIYMIKAEDSKFFGDFVGKSFPYVSYHAHRLYGVGLIGVMSDGPGEKIRLNPGITHILQSKDVLYYMALTNEESLFNFQKDLKVQLKKADIASTIANVGEIRRRHPQVRTYIEKLLKRKGCRFRAYYRPVHKLHPIVLLLELQDAKTPNPAFLDAISYFPDIYWMQGKISVLDNLLRAGVSRAEHVVVVRETASLDEEHLADCSTIITVQKIHRMFPRLRMITELTHASNMRFVQFSADNPYSLAQSKFEKKERKRGSHMPFMFRLPFAQGGVFSANMLDRLLYQAIIKPYVVTLTRLLLGIDQTEGSGFLSSVMVTSNDLWIKTYGRLYKNLCASVAAIPLGVFRTKNMDSKTVSLEGLINSEFFLNLLLCSYLLCSPVKESEKNKWFNPRRGLRRSDNLQETVLDEVNNDPEWTSTDPMLLP
ncbi:unnamed protein product [Nippostrongylus brasiliensis]|uniref:Potassium channel subfamily T member 1 n=1 Tax=Nippostrongylus brasiliensis TaxID=27835 RepID=A0A158QXP5_NIPBR|nr:unnamed protein product [Nippostrongylus brasiliensis]